MKRYIGTKIIHAEPATGPEGDEDGYTVVYEDGYRSWSPRAVFEEAYRPTERMTFGDALVMLKRGHRVARAGWNGKGMYIYLVPANRYPPTTEAGQALADLEPDGLVPYGAYLAMKTADNNVVPWLASQTDMLAEDWEVLP